MRHAAGTERVVQEGVVVCKEAVSTVRTFTEASVKYRRVLNKGMLFAYGAHMARIRN